MLESGAPFPMGDPQPLKVLAGTCQRSAQRTNIIRGTAPQAFRLRADCCSR